MNTGVAATALVALPGTLLDARSLAAATAGFDARTVLLGESPTLDGELDRLAGGVDKPAVWVGHSLGGIVALRLLQRHPHAVSALVLLAANARSGASTNARRREAQWAMAQSCGLRALATDKLGVGYGLVANAGAAAGTEADRALLESLADQAEAVGLSRFRRQLDYAASRPGLPDDEPSCTVPLLLLSGESDTLCPPAHSDEIAALARGPVEHHRLAGGTHLFPLQESEWVRARLTAFVRQHGPGRAT